MPVPLDRVLTLWEETLGRPVAETDDFFLDIGGTSMDAVDLLAAIEDEYRTEVPLGTFFENPTPLALASVVVDERDGRPRSSGSAPGLPA